MESLSPLELDLCKTCKSAARHLHIQESMDLMITMVMVIMVMMIKVMMIMVMMIMVMKRDDRIRIFSLPRSDRLKS